MSQSPSQAEQLTPGTVLAQRFRVEQHIGSGGYANVYRATDLEKRRERAIKEVTDVDAGVRRQFELEAGLLINSSHPNIPRGFRLFEERGRLYLVMEFVRGRDLEDLLNESLVQQRKPLGEEQVLRWAIEVCGALEEMHDRDIPIIHRDIKPANIKITPENKPVLIDFGLAKLQTGGPTRTAAQGVSPGFAPPEQYMAKGKTDARTDIYGLGATLYACLTGKDPPDAPSRLLAQTGTTGQVLVPPRLLAKDMDISEATDRIVVKTLELSPSSRYASARDLREDLATALRMRKGGKGFLQGLQGIADLAPARPSVKRPAVSPLGTGKVVAVDPRRQQKPDPVKQAPPKQPPAALGATGKQQKLAADGSRRQDQLNGRTGKEVALAPARTGKQAALVDARTGKQPALGSKATREAPIVGALALAPAAAPASGKQRAAQPRRQGQRIAQPAAAPSDRARSRSWLNLGGPEISSLGKFALAAATLEACWGALLIALAVLEVAMRDSAQKPYLILAGVWLGMSVIFVALGRQVLLRPVFRRGRVSSTRRAVQGFGLTVYSLAVHGIGIWGLYVFGTNLPNASLAVVAFVLFAVNVFVAGILAVANTLG